MRQREIGENRLHLFKWCPVNRKFVTRNNCGLMTRNAIRTGWKSHWTWGLP